MVLLGKCCFVLPLRKAVTVIGLASTTVAFAGLLLSTSSVLHYFKPPKDILLRLILQICFFLDEYGIAFHTMLFIVSTVLMCGAVSKIPHLLVPWMSWSPFLLTGILVQMVIIFVKKPDLALPVVAFCLMLVLFVIYGTLVVAAHYRETTLDRTVQLRIFNIQDGELPRIVEVPQRVLDRFRHGSTGAGRQEPTVSLQPLQQDSQTRPEPRGGQKWPKLKSAYERFVAATRLPRQPSQEDPPLDPLDPLQQPPRF